MKFDKPHFPKLILHTESFEVKAIDSSTYRSFRYDEITSLTYSKKIGNWAIWPFVSLILDKTEPFKLMILKKNGGDWTSNCPANENKEFQNFVEEVNRRCVDTDGNNPQKL